MTTDARNSFAARLRQLRTEAGLSQEELAERAGLSRRGIADLERGARRSPYPATVRRLADAFGLNADGYRALVASAHPDEAVDAQSLSPLPVPSTRLVGRQRELAEVRGLLASTRLLTLTGPGGSGKTRLALEVARGNAVSFPDGVALVLMAPLVDQELVASAIAQVLGVREPAKMPLRKALVEHLKGRRLLLLLDNFEHLLDAASLISDLLGACPHLTVLATSREALRVRDEQVFPVPPLALPSADRSVPAAALMRCESVELFGQRAAQMLPEFCLTADNARVIADICVRLDGLPLAIELAAARTRVLSPVQLLERLDRRLPLLVGGSREMPARQKTLRDTIAWSHDLLVSDERRVFRRLALCVGGCTLDAADALGGLDAETGRPVLDSLTSLVDKNLIQRDGAPDAEPRFTMFETIREFALEQLEISGELEHMRKAHAAYYLQWLATADPRRSLPPPGGWVRRIDLDYDNLRVATRRCLDDGNLPPVMAAGLALTRYGIFRGHLRELRGWWEEALQRSVGSDPLAWASAATFLAIVLFLQGDTERVTPLLTDSLAHFRLQGNKRGVAHALLQLGWATPVNEGSAGGVPLLREAESLFRELDQYEDVAWTLIGLGSTAQLAGDLGAAEEFYVRALKTVQDLHTPTTIAQAVGLQGVLGLVLACLGSAALLRGDVHLGERRLREGVEECARMSDANMLGTCVMLLAGVAFRKGYPARSARLLGAAEGLWGAVASGLLPPHRAAYDGLCADLEQHEHGSALTAVRGQGRRMAQREVVAYALIGDDDAPLDDPLQKLTPREREVAQCAARGLSNRQIAEELVITEGTARVHVEHILSKLDLHSRGQLAAWSVERGILHG
jgi:predicted ATPase/DNA-binding CsgD family transcriptional regulator/DNA-binding XRE family transcriptional regulator